MEVFVIEVVVIAVILVLFLAPGVVVLPPHAYAFGLLLLAPLLTSHLQVHHRVKRASLPAMPRRTLFCCKVCIYYGNIIVIVFKKILKKVKVCWA